MKKLAVLLIALSVLDLYLTNLIVGYQFELEANPVMRYVLEQYGYLGGLVLKVAAPSLLFVLTHRENRFVPALVIASNLLYGTVVVVSGFYLLGV